MSDLPGWVPTTVVVLLGVVAQGVMMREQVKALVRRMQHVEGKLDAITPRIGEVDRLRRDVDELDGESREMRDAMLSAGLLQPGRRSRAQSRTPSRVAATPMPPAEAESDEGT